MAGAQARAAACIEALTPTGGSPAAKDASISSASRGRSPVSMPLRAR